MKDNQNIKMELSLNLQRTGRREKKNDGKDIACPDILNSLKNFSLAWKLQNKMSIMSTSYVKLKYETWF